MFCFPFFFFSQVFSKLVEIAEYQHETFQVLIFNKKIETFFYRPALKKCQEISIMQLFLEDENLILYVMVRCHFRTIFLSCNMYFEGTWNPYPLPMVLKNSMRNIRGAIKKSAFWASHWRDRNIGNQGKGIIWGPTSFWKCLSGSKVQKPLQKLSHSD